MTTTKSKAESKAEKEAGIAAWTKIEARKGLTVLIKRWGKNNYEDSWAIADRAYEFRTMNQWSRKEVEEIFSQSFCEANHIGWKEKSYVKVEGRYGTHNSYMTNMRKLIRLAFRADYIELRNSGKSPWNLHRTLYEGNPEKRAKEIAKKKLDPKSLAIMAESPEESSLKLGERIEEREAAKAARKQRNSDTPEGFNIEHVDTFYHGKTKTIEGKRVFQLDEDTKWMQTCLSIARETPRLFMQMVDDYLGMILSPETIAAIRKDLFKS